MRRLAICVAAAAALWAQKAVDFETRPATLVENDQLALTVLNKGGAFASLLLKDDAAKNDPMWNPVRLARETSGRQVFGDSIGHFLCVDGFGPTSKEEVAAGFQGHGEAHRQPWEQVSAGKDGKTFRIEWKATLPIVQENLRRKVEMVDGEPVVYVETEIESLVGFDRPMNWAEHATIGAPFLTPEKTLVYASVDKCQVRPHEKGDMAVNTIKGGEDFTYPFAPLIAGGVRNLRYVPNPPNSMDHTGCTMDPKKRLVFAAALRPDLNLAFGYLFRREEYPWLQEWLNFPKNGALSRGLEFGTQPYDVPRRETVDTGKMFGVPTFRWLPAKSKVGSRFIMFYVHTPAGFSQIDDVRQEGGRLVIEDKKSGKTVTVGASRPL